MARLCAVIANMSGKYLTVEAKASDYLPDFFAEREPVQEESKDYFKDFVADVKALGKVTGKHANR